MNVKNWMLGIGAAASLTIAGSASADLIITEFMADSAAVNDDEGEYFEVYNTGAPIAVSSLTIGDLGSDSVDLVGSTSDIIGTGEFYVFGNEPTSDNDFDYSAVGSFFLANSSDEIVITDTGTATVLASLIYTDGDAPGDGIANVLTNIGLAVGGVTQPGDYTGEILANDTLSTGDIGSPGAAGSTVIPEPATLALLGLGGLAMLGRRRSA